MPIRVWLVATGMLAAVLLSVLRFRADSPEGMAVSQAPPAAPAAPAEPDPLSQYDRCEGPAELRNAPEVPSLPRRERRTAAEVLASHDELAQWFGQWKANVGRNAYWRPSSDELAHLDKMIRSAGLSAFDRFDVCAEMLAITGKTPEIWATGTWARAAVDAAFDEIEDAPDPDTERHLVRAIGDAAMALWPAWDGRTLERMTKLMANYPRENRWDQMPEWSVIGHAESLYLQSENTKALTELDEVEKQMADDPLRFTPRQRDEVKWCRALIYYNQQKYADAAVAVRPVANSPGYHHVREAHRLLIGLLAKCGDEQGTADQLREYCRRYKPTAEQTQAIVKESTLEIIRARQVSGHF